MISRLKSARYLVSLLAIGSLAFLVFSTVSADTVQSLTFNKDSKSEKIKTKELFSEENAKMSDLTIEDKKTEESSEDLQTEFTCGDTIVDRDGYEYGTVAVDTQCWMANNLKTVTNSNGEALTNRDDNSQRDCISATGDERGTEADCNAGRTLYTLEAALDGQTTEGSQGLCPTGWHLPKDSELHTLEQNLTNTISSCDANRIGSGCADAGSRMLVGGNTGLNIDYTGLRYRDGHDSGFIGHNSLVILWSSSLTSSTTAYGRYIGDWNPAVIDRGVWGDGTGDNVQSATVRCIKDQPPIPNCGNLLEDRDGYTYSTVEIGGQCWMSQNLRTKTYPNGTCINGSQAPCSDASTADNGKNRSCYNNLESNCAANGAMYTWYGAMNIHGDLANSGFNKPQPNPYTVWNNQQGICPDGWRIPTPDDFTNLTRAACATGSDDCNIFTYGTTATGAFQGTYEANVLNSSSFGFNWNYGGQRSGISDTPPNSFSGAGQYGFFWGAAFNGIISNQAFRTLIVAGNSGVERKYTYRFRSYPVRCVKS
jgi:uncharacterized protein (TIGR02145 family)